MTLKRRTTLQVLVLVLAGLFSGCTTAVIKEPQYYYGTYQKTLYHLKKDPTPENTAKYQACLEDIISKSREKNFRVPPGIHCEYGYLLWQKGQHSRAEEQFGLEIQTYPESLTFVTLVLKMLKHEPPA